MRKASILALAILLGAMAALASPGIEPADPELMGQPGQPPRDYWINTEGDWDAAPPWMGLPDTFPTLCGTFYNYTGQPLKLLEIGFSVWGEPTSSFIWGVYTDVGSMGPPPLAEPEFWGTYHPSEHLSPYTDVDLSGMPVYVAPGAFFTLYYEAPETGVGLFDFNGAQGWYWQGRGWESLEGYDTGYSPAIQFHAINAVPEFTVCPDGGGDYTDIQSAIAAAPTGSTIWLCDGLYHGSGNSNVSFMGKALTVRSVSDDPSACYLMLSPVAPRGNEHPRGPLSGAQRGNWEVPAWEPSQGVRDTDHRGFIFASGEGQGSVLRGVGVIGGSAERGAGVYVSHSSPTIQNCRFINSMVSGWGGGAYCEYSSAGFFDCVFEGNAAPNQGGGGLFGGASDLDVEDCVFTDNYAEYGGGAAFSMSAPVNVIGCQFNENGASDQGGGLSGDSGTEFYLESCVFFDNYASNIGGGMYCYMGAVEADDCDVRENSAPLGGGFALSGSNAWVGDCFFYANEAGYGGGLLADSGVRARTTQTVTVDNCSVVENTATFGAGIFWDNLDMEIFNSIVAFGYLGEGILCYSGCTPVIECTDIFGNETTDWDLPWLIGLLGTAGNIAADPQFCGSEGTGYCELQSDSPCMPGGNVCGVLIGAFGQGCGTQAARPVTWSDVKSLY